MQFKRLILAIIAGLVLALVLTGCGRGTFVTVNGEKVSKAEFYKRLESLPLGGRPAGIIVLDQMINEKLFEQLAKERNVMPTDVQVENKLKLAKKEGSLTSVLQQRGITLDEYKKEIRTQQAFLNIVTKGVSVSDKEIKDFYDKSKDTLYTKPERTQIGAIICKSKDKIMKADAQLKARQDFSTVALNLSDDERSRREGGTLGWVWRGQKGVPENLIENAFALKIRSVSEPFEVKQGNEDQWVILKALDRKPKTILSFADVKDQIREGIAFSKGQRQTDVAALVEKTREKAKIKVNSERYRMLEKKKETKDKK